MHQIQKVFFHCFILPSLQRPLRHLAVVRFHLGVTIYQFFFYISRQLGNKTHKKSTEKLCKIFATLFVIYFLPLLALHLYFVFYYFTIFCLILNCWKIISFVFRRPVTGFGFGSFFHPILIFFHHYKFFIVEKIYKYIFS